MGALMPFLLKRGELFFSRILLFSGAYLMGIALMVFLPDIVRISPENSPWILTGFFFQLVLQKISGGSEHGHIHRSGGVPQQVAIQVFIGLSFHALMDGASVGSYTEWAHLHEETDRHEHGFIYGILMHKTGEGFALASLFMLTKIRPVSAAFLVLAFSLMAPLSAWVVSSLRLTPSLIAILMAIVAGSFLHISASILLESRSRKIEENTDRSKWLIILTGFILAILSTHH
jgi:zinc transporter ZupT